MRLAAAAKLNRKTVLTVRVYTCYGSRQPACTSCARHITRLQTGSWSMKFCMHEPFDSLGRKPSAHSSRYERREALKQRVPEELSHATTSASRKYISITQIHQHHVNSSAGMFGMFQLRQARSCSHCKMCWCCHVCACTNTRQVKPNL